MMRIGRTVTFRGFLAIAALLILLPYHVVGAYLLWRQAGSDRELIEAQLRAATRLAAAAADAGVAEWISSLEALAQFAGDGVDADTVGKPIADYLNHHPGTQALELVRGDGAVVLWMGGLPEVTAAAAATAMWSWESRKDGNRVSGLLRLDGARKPLIAAAIPLRHGAWAGGAILALNDASMMNILLTLDNARPGWQAAIVDQSDVIAADTDPKKVGQDFPLAREANLQTDGSVIVFNKVLDGIKTYVAIRHCSFAPWNVAYMEPSIELDAPRRQSGFQFVIFVILLVIPISASALLGRYLGRRIRHLAAAAASVSRESVPPYLPPTGISEIDVVQNALHRAGEIAQQRAADRERLQDMEEAFHRAERMESLGQLMAAISHDFGNLIFTIKGSLELIQRKLGDDERAKKIVERPLHLANEAVALISQLSASMRHKKNSPARINIENALNDVGGLLREIAGRGVELKITSDTGLFDCNLDPVLLKSALLNLVINARNAMPDGGMIEIHGQNAMLSKQAAEAAGLTDAGNYVVLSVADTGIGIPPVIRARIFEPFFTTREGEAGTGLGLSILHGFVKAAGGSVQVDSTMGEGTTFTMYFPAQPPCSESDTASGPAARSSAGTLC